MNKFFLVLLFTVTTSINLSCVLEAVRNETDQGQEEPYLNPIDLDSFHDQASDLAESSIDIVLPTDTATTIADSVVNVEDIEPDATTSDDISIYDVALDSYLPDLTYDDMAGDISTPDITFDTFSPDSTSPDLTSLTCEHWCPRLQNTESYCTEEGECIIESCDEDFYNADGYLLNGCECQIAHLYDICNGIDDNCNGEVDEYCEDLVLFLNCDSEDELNEGIATDLSGTSNGIATNVLTSSDAILNKSCIFENTSLIEFDNNPELNNSFTIIIHFKPTIIRPTTFLFQRLDENPAIGFFGSDPTRMRVSTHFTAEENTFFYANTDITENTWYSLALTYDGNTISLYLNGELDNSLSEVGISGSSIIFGTDSHPDRHFEGYIDEIAIYKTSRPEDEIRDIFRLSLR